MYNLFVVNYQRDSEKEGLCDVAATRYFVPESEDEFWVCDNFGEICEEPGHGVHFWGNVALVEASGHFGSVVLED